MRFLNYRQSLNLWFLMLLEAVNMLKFIMIVFYERNPNNFFSLLIFIFRVTQWLCFWMIIIVLYRFISPLLLLTSNRQQIIIVSIINHSTNNLFLSCDLVRICCCSSYLPLLVFFKVIIQMALSRKWSETPSDIAMVRFLTSVNSHVSLEIAFFVESSATFRVRTYILLLTHVGLEVNV